MELEDLELVEPDLIETETKNRWHQVATLEASHFDFSLTQQDVVISLPPPTAGGEYSDSHIRWILLTCKIAHVVRVRSVWGHVGNDLKLYADFQTPEVKSKKEKAKLNRFNKKGSLALQDGGDGDFNGSRRSRGT